MSVIPNSVGRLDEVVNAIGSCQYGTVETLLEKEISRCEHAHAEAVRCGVKQLNRLNELREFLDKYGSSEPYRRECEDAANGRLQSN